jgi:broad specificity phosphatase PhoE
MTRFLLLRHGRTEWNREVRFRGRADLSLDETGHRQAEAAAERVAGWRIVGLYSSPLKRAQETARAVAQRLGLPVQISQGLIDVDYGSWQGLSPQEAAARDGSLYRLWMEEPHHARFPQGESLAEVRERGLATLEELSAKHEEETVLLVSHQVVLKVLLCAALGLDNSHFWQVEQDVSALNIVEKSQGNLRVALLNDTCHLKGLG